MTKYHTTHGMQGGKERLRGVLYEALAVHKTRGIREFEAEIQGYVYENPSLKNEEQAALSILHRITYQSEAMSESEIERF